MDVVVVESPAKAKTINKYLGSDYTVLASYGHVRDLPSKDGSVRPDDDFAMDWAVDPKSKKHLDAIAAAVRHADRLYLATDPDREGEAISWHVAKVLAERKALNGVDIHRVVFNEITRDAIVSAFSRPRALDDALVDAYLARRALDYLVGFTLSPVLWRKLPGSRSAGRVQSVALRLICERETEIEDFRAREYWTVKGLFRTDAGAPVEAGLTHLVGRKLEKFDLGDEAAAAAAVAAVQARTFAVAKVERKQVRRNPAPPFITSTLQQEASRKFGFAASRTMQLAQRLYEGINIGGETVGLITYMRTDGVQMAAEAITACRGVIGSEFGARYVPEKPRIYKTRAKNAQEAHEAIRPTSIERRPQDIARDLDADQLKLYTLIWKRTVASQMASAVLDQVAADIAAPDGQVVLRATGSVVAFDGFFRVYREGTDDPERGDARKGDDEDKILPDLAEGQRLNLETVTPEQHFTQPPPRYSEASLVKRLEELGIGRPSTYATILSVLQERDYVRLENKRFVPEDRGRLVTAFLASFFERYVAYGFTAEMEERLDDVSGGRIDWKTVLRDFWKDFSGAVAETKDLGIKDVLDALNRLLGPHFFPDVGDGADPRACPSCKDGRLSLKIGRYGAFIGCSNYPDCRYTRPLVPVSGDEGATASLNGGPRLLGEDPATGQPVTLRNGPYGPYIQLGEAAPAEPEATKDNDKGKEKGKAGGKSKAKAKPTAPKPKRASLPRGVDADNIDLDRALALLSLPREVGRDPDTQAPITAGIGRYGPYVCLGDTYVSLKGDDDVLTIGLNRAVALIADARQRTPPGRNLGEHPKTGKPVTLKSGRYGPYVQHAALRATLPKGVEADTLDLAKAIEILEAKAAREGKGASGKGGRNGGGGTDGGKPATGAKPKAGKPKAGKATTGRTKAGKDASSAGRGAAKRSRAGSTG